MIDIDMLDIFFIVLGVLIGALASGWYFVHKQKKLRQDFIEKQTEWGRLQAELDIRNRWYEETRQDYENRIQSLADELNSSRHEVTDLKQNLTSLQERNTYLTQMKDEAQALYEKFKTEFETLNTKFLKENTEALGEQSRKTVNELLNPLKERLEAFDRKITDLNAEQREKGGELRVVLEKLLEQNKNLSEEADRLAKAIKGDVKKLGNWGELILERVLEISGLEKGREYVLQWQMSDIEGKALRPDAIILLPDNKQIIIDSKVSLAAFDQYLRAETEEEASAFAHSHVEAVKTHIQNLSSKQYQNLNDLHSTDFVLMFIPIEPALALALSSDPDLYSYALKKNIILVSPTTLLATLRTVEMLWRQEKQQKNIDEIIRLASNMYDKLRSLVDKLEDLGKNIQKSSDLYDDVMRTLTTGKGNLIKQALKMQELGTPVTKKLSSTNEMLSSDEEETEN